MRTFVVLIGALGTIIMILYLLLFAIKRDKNRMKRGFKGVGIAVVIFIIGLFMSNGSSSTASTNTNTVSKTNAKNEEPKKVTKEEDTKKEQFDFTNAELTKENATKAISDVLEKDKIVGVDITAENGKNIVDITYNPGDVWDEKALVKSTAVNATKAMEILFKNPKVDKVWFWTQTNMTDAKGNTTKEKVVNVALTKENAKEINWSNFKDMVQNDYNALFKIADGKFIAPGIAQKLK